LLAKAELDARNGVFVSAYIPVHAVNLEQTRVRLIRCFGVASYVAVFVNNGTTNAIRATTRLAKNDLSQLFPSLLGPTSLSGQLRKP